jgi:sodium/hydrogen antiporter
MDTYILNFLVIGLLLLFVTLWSGWIARLPFSYALIYLCVGILLGPYGFSLIELRPQAEILERLTEFAVLISLFGCGLKMNRPLKLQYWNSTARLIGFLMPICIFALAAVAHGLLSLPWGAAIVLGAILAPTDPVLASEMQILHHKDRDELRFGLTSEGGLNDALAFPFVYFGLFAVKDSNWERWLQQWVLVDVFWAIAAGIGMGILVAKAITWIDKKSQRHKPADALMEDFIALSLVMITYSLTELVNGYGFLAVFVAGVVVRRTQRDFEKSHSQLEFTEKIEKLMEVGIIVLLGSLLRVEPLFRFWNEAVSIAFLLLFVIRPVGAWISTLGGNFHVAQRLLYGWFGIRGIGSLYYLSYALGKGLAGEIGEEIAWIVYFTIVFSIIAHGTSATILMAWYNRQVRVKSI